MSLPKEPRQKMINLMYLVLTALLALNVSSEILNAFKTVDRSLNNASKIVDQKDTDIMASFKKLSEKPETREKALVWLPKAQDAIDASNTICNEIKAMKEELKKEAGLKMVDGKESFKEDDLEAATRLFGKTSDHGVGKGQGDVLKQKLESFKAKLLSIDPKLKDELSNSLPIDVSTPDNKDFSDVYFHMTPTVAALTILSKFENDVKNSTAQVVEWCHKQVGQVEVVYDQFQAIASQSTEYTMPGEEITVRAGVGAFSKAAQPSVVIDGQSIPLNADGVAEMKFKAGNTGSYSKKVTISFKKPDGTVGTAEKEIKYSVGAPTGVNVSATAVNVLYRGIPNPIAITGAGAEKIQASMDNGSLTKKDNAGNYEANPGQEKVANITVNVTGGKGTKVTFPVKRIPDPKPMVGPYAGGSVPAVNFKAQAGVRADMGDFIFAGVKYNVSKYTIICNGRGFETTGPKYKTVDGPYFDGDVKGYIDMCKPGSSVTIQDIWVEGPDGRRKLDVAVGFSLGN